MGARMTINDSLHQKLDERRARIAMERAVRQGMMELQKNAMKEAPGPGRSRTPNPTGNLRRSHSTEIRVASDMVEGLLKNSANYWQYVQFGTSKMDADDFVTRAVEATQVESKIAKYFHTFYKT